MRTFAVGVFVMMAALAGSPGQAQAQDSSKGIELSFFTPLQIMGPEHSIRGVRFNLIYGRNVSVRGLDIGLVNHTTSGQSVGLQYGIVGVAEDDFSGWQANFLANVVQGTFKGYQSALYNDAAMGEGFQLGLVNRTDAFKGFQLSLFNYTEELEGIQVGLINIAKNADGHPFLPIFNWKFN